MADNGIVTLYDDAGNPIASSLKGKGNALYGALCVVDDGVPILMSSGGSATVPIVTGTIGSQLVKATPGRVCRALVTAAGTSTDNLTIYDGESATGTVLAIILGGTAVGTIVDINMPAAIGIYASNVASGPAVTLSYA